MGAPLNVSGVGEAVPTEALLFRYPQSLAWVMLACSVVGLAAVLLAARPIVLDVEEVELVLGRSR